MNKSYAGPILKMTDVQKKTSYQLSIEEGKDKSDYQQKHNYQY